MLINAGQFGFVANAGTAPTIVPPQQGIQVTMPSWISRSTGGGRGIGRDDDAECRS